MKKQKVALVLSTGGARGLGHIGVIEELVRQGYEISSIAGCSMGALVGAFYASGNLSKGKVFLCSLKSFKKVLHLADLSFSKTGLLRGKRFIKELEKIMSNVNIEDLSIPYTAIATNIVDGKEVVFTKGNLLEAVQASISLPSIFTPIKKGNLLLTDGGITNPLPLNRIKRIKGDILVGVAVSALKETETQVELSDRMNKYNLFSLLSDSSTINIQNMVSNSVEKYTPDIMIQVPNREYGVFQFRKCSEIIENGIKSTKTALLKFEKSRELYH